MSIYIDDHICNMMIYHLYVYYTMITTSSNENFLPFQVENVRRKHNYLPFIVELLKMLGETGQLLPIYEKAKQRALDRSKKESN